MPTTPANDRAPVSRGAPARSCACACRLRQRARGSPRVPVCVRPDRSRGPAHECEGGQGGADILTGNAGNDTFVFNVGQANSDTVIDFAGNGAAVGGSLRFVVITAVRLHNTSTRRKTTMAAHRTTSSRSATLRRSTPATSCSCEHRNRTPATGIGSWEVVQQLLRSYNRPRLPPACETASP
jgi:hypothetical protein